MLENNFRQWILIPVLSTATQSEYNFLEVRGNGRDMPFGDRFFGFTTMPTQFQKVIDSILSDYP